ncbi:hypothetical protein [Pseudoclavibacter sp. RFBA6]|uniref:hypothetical protein n=1 Tax=Pseudoclavibacter sp. RFBA6 TaxID=2080573 RepID=UPI000CE73119|nr:hypothetical protein [Pseudoclavibacter sp. RFBA6]PPG39452.1 hypothetical protein C5C17_11710 [Pseudoclavibacter sp. RFBA6]
MSAVDLTETLQGIRNQYVREDYVGRVKSTIFDYLCALEPAAKVEDTQYFNHSAIPDFVLRWGTHTRNFYIRSSYASLVASRDAKDLAENDPIFLALDARQDVREERFRLTPAKVARAAQHHKYTLVTDTSALDEIASTSEAETPLASVVKTNFISSARGLVDEPTAEKLTGDVPNKDGLTSLLRAKFSEAAVTRMERMASIVELAQGAPTAEQSWLELDGRLSPSELRAILPWVLQNADPGNVKFWSKFGALFTFEQLESLASDVEGLDLGSLVRANARTWEAKRAYLGLHVDAEPDAVTRSGIRFKGGVLEAYAGNSAIRVSHSGNKLKGRPSSHGPSWEALRPKIENSKLHSVTLQGLERAITLEAPASADFLGDVDKMTESVSDTYFVRALDLLLPEAKLTEEAPVLRQVSVNFGESLLIADAPVELGALFSAVETAFLAPGSELETITEMVTGENAASETEKLTALELPPTPTEPLNEIEPKMPSDDS